MAAEAETVTAATGDPARPRRPAGRRLAWAAGQAARLAAVDTADSAVLGDGQRLTAAAWATAVLSNGLSRYDEAWPRPSRPVRTRTTSGWPPGHWPS